jgi:hypothetical protein
MIARFLENLENNPSLFTSIAEDATRNGIYFWTTKPDKQKLLNYLRLAHLTHTWHWRGMFDDGPHTIQLPGKQPFTCGLMKANISVGLASWTSGLELAMIFRDNAAINVYAKVPFEPLGSRGGVTYESWAEPEMAFLQSVWTDPLAALGHLKHAIVEVQKDAESADRTAVLRQMFLPAYLLWEAILEGDGDRMNIVLRDKQLKWKAWHSQDNISRNKIVHQMDTGAVAALCYAHDHGLKITVQSDYLPEFLIKGDFPKLEWPDPEWKK